MLQLILFKKNQDMKSEKKRGKRIHVQLEDSLSEVKLM